MNDAAIQGRSREEASGLLSYPGFLRKLLALATDGSLGFYAWMTMLTAIGHVGVNAWANQVAEGMIVTHMTDHVSWGLHIAILTFCVGLAAGGVMMVIPAYLYDDEEMHKVVIIGEVVAIAAIVMCTLSVMVDLGRKPNAAWYVPFVFLSIFWAISIHTVTAFLYCGLGGRPFWNTALLAPRFLASAFVSGPAFIILVMRVLRITTGYTYPPGPARTLIQIIRVAMVVNLVMLVSEIFTLFYTGGGHATSAEYLFFGLHGRSGLVPWIWASIAMNLLGTVLFFLPAALEQGTVRILACLLCIVGIWIEKGMGLIIPGFIPSTLHEIVEYAPSLVEWKVTAGIWAFGLLVLTLALRTVVMVFTGRLTADTR
jgi:molybdopterin-containing oxidoreductase family membrane subunit